MPQNRAQVTGRFNGFTYSAAKKCLLSPSGAPVALRAKSLAVLKILAERSGHVVVKDELIKAAWSNVVVTDDSLTQCISDIRRVIRDDSHRTLKTIPRQGYMLIEDDPGKDVEGVGNDIVSTLASEQSNSKRSPLIRRLSTALAVFLAIVAVLWSQPWRDPIVPADPARMAFPLPSKPSIAVLPFTDLSEGSQQQYFSDGMTEDLTTDLSKISGLFVVSTNSAFSYKGKATKIGQVAEELGVRFVLTGSVRRSDDQVRINAQLVDAVKGNHVWAERYDGSVSNVFALQDQITDAIVRELSVSLLASESKALTNNNTSVPAAHDAFLEGWALMQSKSIQSFKQAKDRFEQAVALDPAYGRAWGALAELYYRASLRDYYSQALEFDLPDVAELLEKSLANPTVQGYRAKLFQLFLARKFSEMPTLLEKMERLEPNYSVTYTWRGVLAALSGETDNALQFFQTARRYDPTNAIIVGLIGRLHLQTAEYAKSLKALEQSVSFDVNEERFLPDLAAVYALAGQDAQAKAARDKLVKVREAGGFLLNTVGDFTSSDLNHPEYRSNLRLGLQLAGIPAKLTLETLNLRPEYRIVGQRLKNLLGNNVRRKGENPAGAWMADHMADGTGIQYWLGSEVARRDWRISDDKLYVSYRSPSTREPQVCEIYRNPRGTKEALNEYLSVCNNVIAPWAVVPLPKNRVNPS